MAKTKERPRRHIKFWLWLGGFLVLALLIGSLGSKFGLFSLGGWGSGNGGDSKGVQEAQVTFAPAPESQLKLRVENFKDLAAMANKIKDKKEPISQYLWSKCLPVTQQMLQEYSGTGYLSQSLEKALVADLNQILYEKDLYTPERFKGVGLTEETLKSAQKNVQGDELLRLNRQLLEEAYSHEIAIVYIFSCYRDQISYRNEPMNWEKWEEMLRKIKKQKEQGQEVAVKLVFEKATTTIGFQNKVEGLLNSLGISFGREAVEKK
jgi:hypothetical protein